MCEINKGSLEIIRIIKRGQYFKGGSEMKKVLSVLVLMVLMVSVAQAGLFGGKSKKEKIDEKLAGSIVFFTSRTDRADTTIRELADEFEKIHPGAKVEIQTAGGTQVNSVLSARAAAGELPDVTIIIDEWINQDLPSYFQPIDELFDRDEIYFYDEGVINGNLYKVRTALLAGGIIYNKKAFEKAGITKAPKTMKEFYEVCEKLKAAGIIPFGSNFRDQWPLGQMFSHGYVETYVNSVHGKDNLTNGKFIQKGNGMYEYLEFYREMNKKGNFEPDLMSTNWDSFKIAHAKGEIAMTFLGSWYPTQLVEAGLDSELVGMFPMPGTQALYLTGGFAMGVAKTTEYPKTAKAFLKFLFEDGRFAKAVGVVPPLKGVKITAPGINELMNSGLPVLEAVSQDKFDEVFRLAGINIGTLIQEYIIADDPEFVIEKYNNMWERAKEKWERAKEKANK